MHRDSVCVLGQWLGTSSHTTLPLLEGGSAFSTRGKPPCGCSLYDTYVWRVRENLLSPPHRPSIIFRTQDKSYRQTGLWIKRRGWDGESRLAP